MPCIVIDNGSENMRAGFGGEDAPKVTFPTVVASAVQKRSSEVFDEEPFYFGHEALNKRGKLRIRYPIEYGVITNWENVEELWVHTIQSRLQTNAEENPILMTETPFNPKMNREKMTQVMFESLNSPSFYLAKHPVMAMLASGRQAGVILDLGGQEAHVIPIWEGYFIPTASFGKTFINGTDLTYYLMKLLSNKGINISTCAERDCIKSMKENLCYCPIDYELEMKKPNIPDMQRFFQLPDGKTIILDQERYQCPELLFRPNLDKREIPSTQEMIKMSIDRMDWETRNCLYENIVLSGASTLIQGFPERLEKEVSNLAPKQKTQVVAMPERNNASWIGGSILANMSSFQKNFITKEEYDEYGPYIVHRKCF